MYALIQSVLQIASESIVALFLVVALAMQDPVMTIVIAVLLVVTLVVIKNIIKPIMNRTGKENQDYGYLSIFQLRPSPELSTYAFDDANVEWLHCVAAHRKRLLFLDVEDTMAKYDIIAGKIADDATNATLAAYLVGAFGIAGSKEADDFCIKQLLPNKLKDQYCFKTTAALDCLHFVESEKIWLKK